ncbi:ComEC/Rec2 family competence protein [Entomoplasma freundtii]|nr:MBL fold metallo-hydrolase [Entomoplasma freundtii]
MLEKNQYLLSLSSFLAILFYLFWQQKRYPWLFLLVLGPLLLWLIQTWYFQDLRDLGAFYSNLKGRVVKNSGTYGIIKIGRQSVLWIAMPPSLTLGQNVNLSGWIQPLKEPPNSFSFDFSAYLRSQTVFKGIKVENYQLLPTHNLRFYFFSYWQTQAISPFLNFLLWNDKTNLEIKNQLNELNLGYLLNGTMLINIYYLKRFRNKVFGSKPSLNTITQVLFTSLFLGYLYLAAFPWFLVRFTIAQVLNLVIRQRHWNWNRQTRSFVILYSLYFINARFILQSGVWYLVIVGIFFTSNDFKMRGLRKWTWHLARSFGLFCPLEIIFNYRLNFIAPFLFLGLLPWFQFLNGFVFFAWWWPKTTNLWTFLSNITQWLLDLSTKLSWSWNFGSGLIVCFVVYFWGLWKIKGAESWKSNKWVLILTIASLILALSWAKISLETESFWMLNVGNGSSFLYVNKFKNTVIIYDCGSGPGFSPKIMGDFLKFKGLNHIDYLFISHFHLDHYNGLEHVQKLATVKNLITNEYVGNLAWTHKGIQMIGWKLDKVKDYNDTSLIILLILKNNTILLVGDLTKVGEANHLENPHFLYVIGNIKIDLLQLGHHGSKNSSSEAFLNLVNPRMIFISAGLKNNHQFPDAETIKILNKMRIPFVSTHIKINWVWNLTKNQLKSFY